MDFYAILVPGLEGFLSPQKILEYVRAEEGFLGLPFVTAKFSKGMNLVRCGPNLQQKYQRCPKSKMKRVNVDCVPFRSFSKTGLSDSPPAFFKLQNWGS